MLHDSFVYFLSIRIEEKKNNKKEENYNANESLL